MLPPHLTTFKCLLETSSPKEGTTGEERQACSHTGTRSFKEGKAMPCCVSVFN
jgi:hypothetical protein